MNSIMMESDENLMELLSLSFEDNPEDVRKAVSERWNTAVFKAKQKLSSTDFETIQSFKSAEALLQDLQNRQTKLSKNQWLPNLKYLCFEPQWSTEIPNRLALSDTPPAIKVLRSSIGMFLMIIAPRSLEFAVMWGLIYLLTTLSLKSKTMWTDFVKRLERIRRNLNLLNMCAKSFSASFPDELSRAMVQVFTTLIQFWIQTVHMMRENSTTHGLGSMTGQIESKFSTAMEDVEASIKYLRDLASVISPPLVAQFDRLENERRARQDELASMVDVSDDCADYPVNLAPTTHLSAVFYGREEAMQQINAALDGPLDRLRSVLIHGLGGVGKTQTALHYAHRNAANYDAIFWIRSETTLSINASISAIARSLKLPGSMREDVNDEQNCLAFQSWLRTQAARKSGRRWLMIFDNVDNIEDIGSKYVPTSGGSVIITSRYPDTILPTSSEISLKPFAIEDSIMVLRDLMKFKTLQIRGQEDESALKVLADKIDGLPLGLRVIAGLMNINSRKDMTVSKFLNLYSKGSNKLLKTSGHIVEYEGDRTRRIGTEHVLNRVWNMSFMQLENDSERKDEARVFLGAISLFCPDGIPQSLFGPDITATDPDSALHLICDEHGLGLDAAMAVLSQMALADLDGPTITIHRLIQDAYIQFLMDEGKGKLEHAFDSAITILQRRFPRQIHGRPMHSEWQKCRKVIEHAKWLAERYSQVRSTDTKFPVKERLAELLKHCAWYLFEMADHRTALHMLEIALDACPEKGSELYAHLLNTMGSCSFELNDLQTCRRTWVEALAIRKVWAKKNVSGAKEELANQLNNFGNLESAEGKYESALDLFEQARKIRVQLGADAIVPLAVTYMTTGRAYFLKGMYAEATASYKKAEDIFLEVFGPKGHFMAHLNYAYGNLRRAQNKEDAKVFYEKSCSILRDETPFHLLLAACYYKIACLCFSSGDRKMALELLEKALRIAEFCEAVGDTARALRKKADILCGGTDDDKQQANLLLSQVGSIMAGQVGIVFSLKYETEEEWDNWVCPYWR
ncbi:hypothetical protein F4808DRAFT_476374 [Astrocystis sublimbata]|nr:hypothetical protein F4808DRAFT_476374 [Astrocystis sublimbata]